MEQSQTHPLYKSDRDHVDRLLAKEAPDDHDIVTLARLFIRYEAFEGAEDLRHDMEKILRLWSINIDSLNTKSRIIWENGYKPGRPAEENLGSGFDTTDTVTT